MKFFPIILHRSTTQGTLITEWILDPIQLKAAVKHLLQTSKNSPRWVDYPNTTKELL